MIGDGVRKAVKLLTGIDKSITGNVSLSLVGGLVSRALQFSIFIIIARSFGPEALGIFSFGLVILNLGGTVSKAGLDKAVLKFVPIYENEDKERLSGTIFLSLGASFGIGLVISGLLFMGADTINEYTISDYGSSINLFLVGIPFMALMSVAAATTRGYLTTKYSVLIQDFVRSGLAILLVAAAAYIGNSIFDAIVGYVAAIVVAAILGLLILLKVGGLGYKSTVVFEPRKIFIYSLPLMIGSLAQFLTGWTDIFMLGIFGTSREVGIYQAGYQTAAILGFVLVSVNSIFPPIASKLIDSRNMIELGRLYSSISKWVTYLTVFGYLVFIIYPEPILAIFGQAFLEAKTLLFILGFMFVVNAGVGPAGYLLMMAEYERLEMINTIFAGTLNVFLNFVLIQRFGILGAAIATAISLTLINLARAIELRRFLALTPEFRNYWKGVLGLSLSAIVLLAGKEFQLPQWQGVILFGALSFFLFSVTLLYLDLDDNDWLLIRSIR